MTTPAVIERTETTETPNPSEQEQPQGTPPVEQATEDTTRATPAAEATETPKDDGTATPPPSSETLDPEALRLEGEQRARQKIEREAVEAETKRKRDELTEELRTIRREGENLADSLADSIEDDLPDLSRDASRALRNTLRRFVQNLNLKSVEAAKLELGDKAQETISAEARFIQTAFDAAVPDSVRSQFVEATKGKPFSEWPKALLDHAPPSAKATQGFVDDLVTHGAAVLPEGEERDAFTTATKDAKNAKAVAEALYKAARAVESRTPGETPAARERGGNGNPTSREEAVLMHAGMHPSGQRLTNAQMRRFNATGQI